MCIFRYYIKIRYLVFRYLVLHKNICIKKIFIKKLRNIKNLLNHNIKLTCYSN